MPNKNTKAARRSAAESHQAPSHKDDGTRWLVVRHGAPVYPSRGGTTRHEAERLAESLREPATIIQVK